MGREVVALGQKMVGVARHHFNAPVCRARAQQFVQPPLVRELVLEARGPGGHHDVVHHIEHGAQRVRLVDGHVVHAVALLGPGRGKPTHGQKERQHFLNVMSGVVRLLPALHEHRDHPRVDVRPPRMRRIQLVTKDQAHRVRGTQSVGWREC